MKLCSMVYREQIYGLHANTAIGKQNIINAYKWDKEKITKLKCL